MTSKERIKESILKRDFDSLLESGEPSKVVRMLLSISYDKSELAGWRAIEAIGLLTRKVSSKDPEFGRNLVRKLLWSIRDEAGGIGWSSPEILGEIVKNDIGRYPEIPKILWSFIDEEFLRKGIIWATGRISEVAPELMEFTIPYLEELLKDSDPSIRFYSTWALCKLGVKVDVNEDIEEYIYDKGVYEKRNLRNIIMDCNRKSSSISDSSSMQEEITDKYNLKENYTNHVIDRFTGRCLFCGARIDKPDTIKMEFGDFLGGRCNYCGAVYGYDPSGRALGEVYIDVLALLCGGDYNKAINIEEGKDYILKETIYEPLLGFGGGDIQGTYSRKMVFVKMLRK